MIRMRIRELRKARGWTLDDLSKRAHVPKSNLSVWERDLELPTLRTLEKISRAFGARVKELFDETEGNDVTRK